MPQYDLNRMGDTEFERLFQALIKKIIGFNTTSFGSGKDGAREATYFGKSEIFPQTDAPWAGDWIFQAKFHDINLIGVDKARSAIMTDIDSELGKIVNKYKYKCDNFVLATNVPFTGVFKSGMIDRLKSEIIPKYEPHIKNICIWHYEDICRFIDNNADVRSANFDLITTGDILSAIYNYSVKPHLRKLDQTSNRIRSYISRSYTQEAVINLDQVGKKATESIALKDIFIDLNLTAHVELSTQKSTNFAQDGQLNWVRSPDGRQWVSAVEALLQSNMSDIVLVGGPGQGKSTLTQLICQVHRAYLLGRKHDFAHLSERAIPNQLRLPIRIELRLYAQWISDRLKQKENQNLESYIASQISDSISSEFSSDDLKELLINTPSLLVLDGLDEVTNAELKTSVLKEAKIFINYFAKLAIYISQ